MTAEIWGGPAYEGLSLTGEIFGVPASMLTTLSRKTSAFIAKHDTTVAEQDEHVTSYPCLYA